MVQWTTKIWRKSKESKSNLLHTVERKKPNISITLIKIRFATLNNNHHGILNTTNLIEYNNNPIQSYSSIDNNDLPKCHSIVANNKSFPKFNESNNIMSKRSSNWSTSKLILYQSLCDSNARFNLFQKVSFEKFVLVITNVLHHSNPIDQHESLYRNFSLDFFETKTIVKSIEKEIQLNFIEFDRWSDIRTTRFRVVPTWPIDYPRTNAQSSFVSNLTNASNDIVLIINNNNSTKSVSSHWKEYSFYGIFQLIFRFEWNKK